VLEEKSEDEGLKNQAMSEFVKLSISQSKLDYFATRKEERRRVESVKLQLKSLGRSLK